MIGSLRDISQKNVVTGNKSTSDYNKRNYYIYILMSLEYVRKEGQNMKQDGRDLYRLYWLLND
jgi:hypothetical protein